MAKAAEQKFACIPLNDWEYEKTFDSFRKSTNQIEKMHVLIDPILREFQGKRIKFMSVGSGDGSFEDLLIKRHDLMVTYFHGIEPCEQRRILLQNTVQTWNTECFIDEKYFDEGFETDKVFDLILMSHVLYSLPKPTDVVLKAKRFLASNGKLIIFLHSRKGQAEVAYKVAGLFDPLIPGHSHEELAIEDISEELNILGQHHEFAETTTQIDVTEFIEKQATDSANDVISFMLNTRFEKLLKYVQNDIYKMVKDRCLQNEEGRFLFQNVVGMIELKQL